MVFFDAVPSDQQNKMELIFKKRKEKCLLQENNLNFYNVKLTQLKVTVKFFYSMERPKKAPFLKKTSALKVLE